jgi:hypothetical protein
MNHSTIATPDSPMTATDASLGSDDPFPASINFGLSKQAHSATSKQGCLKKNEGRDLLQATSNETIQLPLTPVSCSSKQIFLC